MPIRRGLRRQPNGLGPQSRGSARGGGIGAGGAAVPSRERLPQDGSETHGWVGALAGCGQGPWRRPGTPDPGRTAPSRGSEGGARDPLQESQPGAGGARALPAPTEGPGDGRGRCEKTGNGNLSRAAPAPRVAAPPLAAAGSGPPSVTRCHPPRSKKPPPFTLRVWMGDGLPLFPSLSSMGVSAPPSPAAPPPQLQTHSPQRQRPSPPGPAAGAELPRRGGHRARRETRVTYWTRECCQATPGARTRGSLSSGALCPVWLSQDRLHLCTRCPRWLGGRAAPTSTPSPRPPFRPPWGRLSAIPSPQLVRLRPQRPLLSEAPELRPPTCAMP